MKRYIKYMTVLMLLVSVVLTSGCRSGRTGVNRTRLANKKDDVKIDSIVKLITIEGRDYVVLYARFRNNKDKELKDVRFYCKIKNAEGEIEDTSYCFEIDSIPAKKTEQGTLYISIPQDGSINDYDSIMFEKYWHADIKEDKSCSKVIELKFKDMRTEEMDQ